MTAELYYSLALPLILVGAVSAVWNTVLQTIWYRRQYDQKRI